MGVHDLTSLCQLRAPLGVSNGTRDKVEKLGEPWEKASQSVVTLGKTAFFFASRTCKSKVILIICHIKSIFHAMKSCSFKCTDIKYCHHSLPHLPQVPLQLEI